MARLAWGTVGGAGGRASPVLTQAWRCILHGRTPSLSVGVPPCHVGSEEPSSCSGWRLGIVLSPRPS